MSMIYDAAKALHDGVSDARHPRGIWAVVSTWIYTMSALGWDCDEIQWGVEWVAKEYAEDTLQHKIARAYLDNDLDSTSAYGVILKIESPPNAETKGRA